MWHCPMHRNRSNRANWIFVRRQVWRLLPSIGGTQAMLVLGVPVWKRALVRVATGAHVLAARSGATVPASIGGLLD